MDSATQKLQVIDAGSEVNGLEREQLLIAADSTQTEAGATEAKKIKKNRLINKLNYLNFQERPLVVMLQHRKYGHSVSVQALSEPCSDDRLECIWVQNNPTVKHLKYYKFKHLMVPDGHKLLLVEPELMQMSAQGLVCQLPDTCCEVSSRKIDRHTCKGITAVFIQNGTIFEGDLLDFSAVSFRVRLQTTPPQTFQWLNHETEVTVVFKNGDQNIYSGGCSILKQTCGQKIRDYVLQPMNSEIQRFKQLEYRSARVKITPSPDVIFRHPLTRKIVNLKAYDLSGSGFSVEENAYSAVLIPGMVIPEISVCLANSFTIKCKAQVVYRKEYENEGGLVNIRCGLALLDMAIEHHVTLVALLQQAENKNSYISNRVDLDALWDFFFETGFIYPHKYEFIQRNKARIKSTYRKLYTQNPNIARHFIYQERGQILGHMAMVRFYENTWLIHHHAARSSIFNRAGIIVLNQIGQFVHDSYRLYSMHMDFVMCFYRPDNKFPNRVFGGAARSVKDPKGCSVDPFAYLHIDQGSNPGSPLPPGWQLDRTEEEDLIELESFYEHDSGGLMLSALNIEPGNAEDPQLYQEYRKLGFKREKLLYSIKKSGALKAIIIVNISDIGLNLSDLTNCIMALVLDPEDFPKQILSTCLERLSDQIELTRIPVLVYPSNYVAKVSMPFEKIYNLWILNPLCNDAYFSYMNRLLRFVKNS